MELHFIDTLAPLQQTFNLLTDAENTGENRMNNITYVL